MRIQGFTTGVFQANCFVVTEPDGVEAILVDPGMDAADTLLDAVTEAGCRVRAVLLTHGHVDHVTDAAQVATALDVPCYLHPADRYLLEEPGASIGAPSNAWQIEIPTQLRDLADGDTIRFGAMSMTARHAPGHTPGSCIFVTDGLVVSGDLIFQGSVGRTDFPRGSAEDLFESIRRLVLPLDDATIIISGHGPATTVGDERRSNPFLVGDDGRTLRSTGL